MAKILITGSTGYVGSRLIQDLGQTSHQLICTARRPEFIAKRIPKNAIAVKADFTKEGELDSLFSGCDVAFFLIHALGEKKGFEEIEATMAEIFCAAAKVAGVKKIIYLGGLVDESGSDQSSHMRSRKVVGQILRASTIPVVEFRASVILGAGSTSFELIRALIERLPVMVTPKWVRIKAQPIFIDDVIAYLTEAIDMPFENSEMIEIGGSEIVTYQNIMMLYAKVRNLNRHMVPVPFLTPYLSSLWLGLVTPVYARVGRKLIDSITSESIVKNRASSEKFSIRPLGCYQAIQKCLAAEDDSIACARWSDALSTSIHCAEKKGRRYGNRIIDSYRIEIPKKLTNPFGLIESIGGKNGWYFLTVLWKIRGWIDLFFGGIGMRRGRKNQNSIAVGDTIDWWRVESYDSGKRLGLKAEMKLPGRAWLNFELVDQDNKLYLQQTIVFDPLGLGGLLYWYLLVPVHWVLFKGMLRNIINKSA